jgi:hypothetical protein
MRRMLEIGTEETRSLERHAGRRGPGVGSAKSAKDNG